MTQVAVLWRRIDVPGHDACRLTEREGDWQLDGAAVFGGRGLPVLLTYHVACDTAWRTRRGHVRGCIGPRCVEFGIERTASGAWTMNGAAVPGLEGCTDLDLGFTPATNLLPVRRLALSRGQSADAPAAWLDVVEGSLRELPQRYERRGETTYWYEAPTAAYAASLEVTPDGFVRTYPGLWEMET